MVGLIGFGFAVAFTDGWVGDAPVGTFRPSSFGLLAILCGMEGQSYRVAAEQIGISEEAAKKRWQRLCGKLRGLAG